MYEALRLSTLREGESAYVTEVSAGPAMDRRLTDLGLVRGTRVTCVLRSPAGDPCAYLIRGAVIALRQCDASTIVIGPAYAAGVLASPVSPLPAAELAVWYGAIQIIHRTGCVQHSADTAKTF